MKNYNRRIISILLLFTLLFTCAFVGDSVSAQASSAKWKKACKAYTTYLTKNKSKFKAEMGEFQKHNNESYKKADYFLLVDLDKNGIPELVVEHPYSYKSDFIYVYTYKNGKVVEIRGVNGEMGQYAYIDVSCQADGWYHVYKCKKSHLHAKWSAAFVGSDEYIYTVKKGKLKLYARGENVYAYGKKSYQINGKKVSAKKYKAMLKKCGNSGSGLKSNTKSSRKKYLK